MSRLPHARSVALLAAEAAVLGLAAACVGPTDELDPGTAFAMAPLVPPIPAEVFEAGTGGGAMQDVLLVRVVVPDGHGADHAARDIEIWADTPAGRREGRTDDDGRILFTGVEPPVDLHVFGADLYRTLLDVRAAAVTVRLGAGARVPPPSTVADVSVSGLAALDGGPIRFGHVRHWSWPRAGGLRPDHAISEDVAAIGPGLPDALQNVRVTVPEDRQGALLVLAGATAQSRLTSWGREVGWDAVTHLGIGPVPPPDERPSAVEATTPLSDVLSIRFPEVRRFLSRVGANRWEARYELIDPELGPTRALAAGRSATFGQEDLQIRIPAAQGPFARMRFAVTVRAYAGDWWVAQRTLPGLRGEAVVVDGFPSDRPGRTRRGRVVDIGVPNEAAFARLIFQAGAPVWWVDVLDPQRELVHLPSPPAGSPDPLQASESPLMRAHYFRGLDTAAWSDDGAHRRTYLGVSTER